jgi:hypothetical protein
LCGGFLFYDILKKSQDLKGGSSQNSTALDGEGWGDYNFIGIRNNQNIFRKIYNK